MDAESNSRRWELKAGEAVEREVCAEAEIDATRHEVAMARKECEAAVSARA